nr:hypothetical protein [Tanacetum cinerariifolium]
MPYKDTLYNGRKGIGFENLRYFEKAKDLRPSLYDEKVIGLGYTPMFLIHSDEALEIEKFKRARENKIEFALNASYVNEKINFSDDYFQEIINTDFEMIDSPFQQTSSLKPYVPTVILEKIIIDLEDEVVSLLEKEKANLKTIESLKSKDLDTFSSVRRPKQSNVIWKKKWSSNTSNVDLSSVSYSKLNKDVKQYSRKDLLSCNNSHLGETSSAYVCNDAMNVSCNSRLCDSFDENNLFILMMKVTVHRWLPKMQPLAEPVAKWIPRVERLPKMKFEKDHLCFACEQGKIHKKHHKSKTAFASNKPLYLFHMDICGSMRVESINGKRYVLVVVDDYSRYTWRVRSDNGTEFKNKTLARFFDEDGITQQFSAARTPQQNGVVERRNRTLVEAARIMLTFANIPLFLWAEAIATACFIQNRSIIHKRFDKTLYELINMRKPNIKFFRVFGCRCYLLNDYEDVGKLKAKGDIGVFVGYSKESAAFRIYNKRTRKIHESMNVNFDEISEMASKQFSLEPGLFNLNETEKSSNPSVSQVSESSKKDLEDLFHNFYDEYFDASKIMKSSTTNVESSNVEVPLPEKEVFHESFESFQEESSSSSLNDDVQQSLEEVGVPSSNTQSVSSNMVLNVVEASTSHNVFNKRLEDAYFDASTSFHDPSNVHTFYQPYPHEKKWTKDHPFHKIIGDPKSSVRTR